MDKYLKGKHLAGFDSLVYQGQERTKRKSCVSGSRKAQGCLGQATTPGLKLPGVPWCHHPQSRILLPTVFLPLETTGGMLPLPPGMRRKRMSQ